ncbi:MAG TPA: hypothetical protein VLJ16_11695 [Acidobacteriota bacterium]|nr:hypothetical protein [Acidobacteriota bacterium]
MNPAQPRKGTVKLEIERARTINPYDQPDAALRMILFCRDEAGQVILYDPNGAEAHRFAPDGKYLGLLTKKGQGPGEFSPMQGYRVNIYGPDIWVFGGMKVARFDAQGRLVKDKVLKHHFYEGVDAGRFLTIDSAWTEKKDQIRTLKLIEFTMEGEDKEVDLLQAENIGMIRNPNGQGGFGEGWGTPDFFNMADPDRKLILCGLNTEYKILAKDYSGINTLVIEKAYQPIKARRADVEKLMSWSLRDERTKWMIAAYPDQFVAITNIRLLPLGHFAVFRVSGPGMFEIDVFSPDGECLYALIPPDGVKMDEAIFFSSGFSVIEPDGDYSVYREYRIKNLPEVFGR